MSSAGGWALRLPFALPGWVLLVVAALDLAALVTIWMGRRHSRQAKTLWTIIVLLLPILGALGWFLLGHERRRRRR
jgi:hypothetical protein